MTISLAQLQEVFNETFEDCPAITEDTMRSDIDSWDSMSQLSLVLNLEERFGHAFSMEEIESIKGVKDVLRILG